MNPTGVAADLVAQGRVPVLRLGGIAFNDTFVGAGAHFTVTPVHLDTAARVDLQLVDLLPITVEAGRGTYWESPWGLVPVQTVADGASDAREPLYEADRDFAATTLWASVSPTVQAKAGPVVGFTNVTVTWLRIRPEVGPERWVFEPYRGTVVAYDDRMIEHASAILWEPADGEERSLLRVGPVLRGRSSAVTPDLMLTAGALVQWRPGRSDYAPTFTTLVTPYLEDPDFEGIVPFVAALVTFTKAVEL